MLETEKLTENWRQAQKDVRQRMLTYIGAGLGLVVGLAWNEAITALIKIVFPGETKTLVAKFVYALVLTLFVGLALFYVEKVLNREVKK